MKGTQISFLNKMKVALYSLAAFLIVIGIAVYYSFTQGVNYSDYSIWLLVCGGILMLLIFVGTYFYLYVSDKDSFNGSRTSLSFLSLMVLTIGMSLFTTDTLSIYFRPLALAGLVMTVLRSKSMGMFINAFTCIAVLLVDLFFTQFTQIGMVVFPNIFLGLIAGSIFVYLASKIKSRVAIMFMSFKMLGVNLVLGFILQIMSGINIFLLYNSLWAAGSAMLSSLLFMGILPLYELIFNYITDFRLHELCDHNNKLLVELKEKAPGTFNHCLVLANIAEMCAIAIGENSNLARACAYYHDIGKLSNTVYFKENQGEKNPHDDITPEVSVNIIKNHVINGVKKAEEFKLPNEIIDVIKEHHGTLPIKVFYYKALKYTDGSLETNSFSYDGPKPKSKISAIIMIADAAEAAARVVEKNSAAVEKVVTEIINERMRLNQFIECDITFKEIYTIKEVIVKTLSGVYHERVKYPELQLGIDEKQ